MDDILSGGKIDSSTSGPTPPKKDDRDRDILLEQKEKQDQDAIGGTEFPPRVQPPPPIPEAPEVAPPLFVIPSFDFNILGSALEETREIARQTVVDVLKNVTINGQGPSFEGSTIAFNIPQQPPASEAFIFQGIMVPQPLPQAQPIQLPVPPMVQPEPAQEIQSFVVSPPSRQQPSQENRIEPVQEPKIPEVASAPSVTSVVTPVTIAETEIQPEQPYSPNIPQSLEPTTTIGGETIQPPEQVTVEPIVQPAQELTLQQPTQAPITISESDVVLSSTEPSPDTIKTVEQPQSKEVKPPFIPEKDEDFAQRYTRLSDHPTFETPATQDESQKTRDDARNMGADIRFDDAAEIREEARSSGTKISFDDAAEIREGARSSGADIGFDNATQIREEAGNGAADIGFDGTTKESEEKKEDSKKGDSNFDAESDIRQEGETMSEYKARMDNLDSENESLLNRESSGPIAISLIRADGEGEAFATFRSDISTESGPTLEKSEYYVGIVNGKKRGDILFWNPDKGSSGQWDLLQAPQAQKDKLRVLTIQNDILNWTETEDCET